MGKILDYLNESPTVFFILKKEDKWELEYVTQNVINIYAHTADEFLSKKIKHEDFIHSEDLEKFIEETKKVSSAIKNEFQFTPYRVKKQDTYIWINHIIKIIRDDNGKTKNYYGYITDITIQKELYLELETHMDIINENVFVSVSDTSGRIVDLSDAYLRLTQYKKEELIGKKHSILKHPDSQPDIFKDLWETITKGRLWKGEHRNIKKDGSVYWVENSITPNFDENGVITGYTSIYNDITDKKEISELLITDYLTKIYNRRHFNTVFDMEFKRGKRDNKNLVLMIIDIDFFKQYNDSYGHDGGDKILYDVAQALKYSLNRSHDFLFRLGGEEFGIISSNIKEDGVVNLAERLRQAVLNLDVEHKTSILGKLSISIGIKIVYPDSKLLQNDIYKLADEALYRAKRTGRNKFLIFRTDNIEDK